MLNTAAPIADIFKGCCALHNFLLHKDGLNSIGAKGTDWTQEKVVGPKTAAFKMSQAVIAPYMSTSLQEAGRERESNFQGFRDRLIVNYEYMWRQKSVWWCKTAAEVRPKVSGTDERMGEEEGGEEGDMGEDSAWEDEGEGGDIGSDSDSQ